MGKEMNLMDGASGDKLLAGVLEHLACLTWRWLEDAA